MNKARIEEAIQNITDIQKEVYKLYIIQISSVCEVTKDKMLNEVDIEKILEKAGLVSKALIELEVEMGECNTTAESEI